MASSQVEIALTSPFGCVLRKYNHRDRFKESASSRVSSSSQVTTFQNNNDRRSGFVVVDDVCNNNCVAVAPQIDAVNNNNVILNEIAAAKKEKEDSSSSSSSSSLSSPNHNNVNPRQSQILDRWAARKAKEMVSTIETEAELLENLGSSTTSSPSSETLNNNNNNNRGASSLVQIWERRLNTNSLNLSLKCNNTTTSRTSSLGSSDVGEILTDETSSSSSCSDWVTSDTNEATCSTPKVADIIKRLKENNYGQDQCSNSNNNNNNLMMMMMGSSPSPCLSSREQGQRPSVVLQHVTSSPRLRGRRALTDLLMQIERDRNGELNDLTQLAPVSNFSQRGRCRIQSLLRLRLLKRHHESRSINEVKRQPKGSTIMHLRERFNSEAKEQRNVTQPETASSSGNHPDQPENPLPPQNHSSDEHYGLNPIGLDRVVNVTNGHQNDNDHCVASDEQPESSSPRHEEEAHHASSSSESTALHLEAQNNVNAASSSSQEIAETSGCNMVDSSGYANHETKDGEADVAEAKQEDNNSAETEIIEEEDHEEYASVGNDDHDEQNYEDDEHYYDWISPIARPRSYWEDRRQAWYKEMLDTASSDNKLEIRQLLQRRTVSSFLSSEFRERMDKLMEFHIGTQTEFISSQEDDEENGGTMGQLISFLQQHIQRHNINGHHHNLEQEQEQEAAQKQEEEEGSSSNGSYTTETNDDQSSSSSSSTQILTSSASPNMSSSSWSYRDNAASDESATSSSSTQPSHPSQSFYQDTLQSSSSSSINPHSMEMDLICEMRGQMEQVYREMAEIRKSLKSCIDMQMMLQTSMKREVNTALKRERKKEEKKKKKKKSKEEKKKENCCICYEKKVDSVLYRCGHMCACVKCANELQWNSGKCPICRAPIVDVVRVYVDA